MRFWIPDGRCDTNPVSAWRWALYKFSNGINSVAEWLHDWALYLGDYAVFGERPRYGDDEIPF